MFGVRGCLNARKERAFENYDARPHRADSPSRSSSARQFFDRLQNPKNLSRFRFETEIQGDRGAADGLVARAQRLDPPGELSDAQKQVLLTFELRRDGLAGVGDQIGIALGKEGQTEAIKAIPSICRTFSPATSCTATRATEINQVLADQGINARRPRSQFLPPPATNWLDRRRSSEVDQADQRHHGGAPGPTVSAFTRRRSTGPPSSPIRRPPSPAGSGTPALEVQVQKQGDTDETDVIVTYTVTGARSRSGRRDDRDRSPRGRPDRSRFRSSRLPAEGLGHDQRQRRNRSSASSRPNNESTYPVTFG